MLGGREGPTGGRALAAVSGSTPVRRSSGALVPASEPNELEPATFSLRGGTTAPHLASTSNFALTVFAPRPHVPHGLTPLRTTNRTTNATKPPEAARPADTVQGGWRRTGTPSTSTSPRVAPAGRHRGRGRDIEATSRAQSARRRSGSGSSPRPTGVPRPDRCLRRRRVRLLRGHDRRNRRQGRPPRWLCRPSPTHPVR